MITSKKNNDCIKKKEGKKKKKERRRRRGKRETCFFSYIRYSIIILVHSFSLLSFLSSSSLFNFIIIIISLFAYT